MKRQVMTRLLVDSRRLSWRRNATAAEPLAWPQFRGPGGSGVADDQKPPVEIGPDKNVKWKVAVPSGLSSPIVVGDMLVLTAFDDGKLYTIAYRRADGSEAWRAEAPAKKIEPFHQTEGSPAASTPATDGERIVSYFGSCGLFCYDLAGKELWKYEMPPAATVADFGTGVSPIIADGAVILLRDETKDPKILAVDVDHGRAASGRQKRESKSGFSTPVVWDTPDGKQVVAAGLRPDDRLRPGDGRREVVRRRHAVGVLHVAGRRRRQRCYFAGWSPGGPEDTDFQDADVRRAARQAARRRRRRRSAVEGGGAERRCSRTSSTTTTRTRTASITREEWEQMLKFMAAARNSAFALRPGGSGDVTESHVLWKETHGLAVRRRRRSSTAASTSWSRTAASSPPTTRRRARSCTRSAPSPPAATTPRRWPPTGTSTSRRWTTAP